MLEADQGQQGGRLGVTSEQGSGRTLSPGSGPKTPEHVGPLPALLGARPAGHAGRGLCDNCVFLFLHQHPVAVLTLEGTSPLARQSPGTVNHLPAGVPFTPRPPSLRSHRLGLPPPPFTQGRSPGPGSTHTGRPEPAAPASPTATQGTHSDGLFPRPRPAWRFPTWACVALRAPTRHLEMTRQRPDLLASHAMGTRICTKE